MKTTAETNRRMESSSSVGLFNIRDCLLVSIGNDLDDSAVLALESRLTEEIARQRIRGVIIDISQLDVVDTFTGRMLGSLAKMSRILDARTVVVGMRPAVAITLVELGMNLGGLDTALNVDKALQSMSRGGAGVLEFAR